MKKFIHLLLIICLLIPISAIFSACEFLNPPNGTPATTPLPGSEATKPENPTTTKPKPEVQTTILNKTYKILTSEISWMISATKAEKNTLLNEINVATEDEYFKMIKSFLPSDIWLHFGENNKLTMKTSGIISEATYKQENSTSILVTEESQTLRYTIKDNLLTTIYDNQDTLTTISQTFTFTEETIKDPSLSATYTLESCVVAWADNVTSKQQQDAINNFSSKTILFESVTLTKNSQRLVFSQDGSVSHTGNLTSSPMTYSEVGESINIFQTGLGEPCITFKRSGNKLVGTELCRNTNNGQEILNGQPILKRTLTFVLVEE